MNGLAIFLLTLLTFQDVEVFKERLVCTVPGNSHVGEFIATPDGTIIEYATFHTGSMRIRIRHHLVIDGHPVKSDRPWAHSQDWTRAAYVESSDKGSHLVVDGEPEPSYVTVRQPVFSPDGQTIAYGMRDATGWYMKVGNRKYSPPGRVGHHGYVNCPAFSPDGKTFAYVVSENRGDNDTYVIVNGKKGPVFDRVGSVAFGAGGRFAYSGSRRGSKRKILGHYVVVDGEISELYDSVNHIVFSPDGETVAYSARENGETFVVVNGERRPVELRPTPPPRRCAADFRHPISPSSPNIMFTPKGDLVYIDEGRGILVIGEEEIATYRYILSYPTFSPDGEHMAYVASDDDNRAFVVVDGERGPDYASARFPVFSPDGSLVVYIANENGKWFIVAGERRGEEVDSIQGPLIFSADGKKVAYRARVGRELWWKVLELPD